MPLHDLPVDFGPRTKNAKVASVEFISSIDVYVLIGAMSTVLRVHTRIEDEESIMIRLCGFGDEDHVCQVKVPKSNTVDARREAGKEAMNNLKSWKDVVAKEEYWDPSFSKVTQIGIRQNIKEDESTPLDLEIDLHFKKLWYRSDLFDEKSAKRFASQIRRACQIDDWEIDLEEADDHFCLIGANCTKQDWPETKCIHDLVYDAAIQRPKDIALKYDQDLECTSYGAFIGAIAELAVNRLGLIHPDEPVALLLRREPSMVVAIYAVLLAGGCYVPIEPDYPTERILTIINDAGCRVVLTQRRFFSVFTSLFNRQRLVFCDDGDPRRITIHQGLIHPDHSNQDAVLARYDDINEENLWLKARDASKQTIPTSLVYIFYTSGTTGKPKGVMVEHRGLVRRIAWFQRKYPLQNNDAMLLKTTYTFGISEWELFWAPTCGAAIVIARHDGHKITSYIADLMSATTVCCFVPSALLALSELVLADTTDDTRHPDAYKNVRLAIACGEALTPATIEPFFQAFPNAVLCNVYGPTEADMTYYELSQENYQRRAPPIGLPMDNVVVYLLDPHGKSVPPGALGELHFGAPAPARGYVGLPNNKAWIKNPYLHECQKNAKIAVCPMLYATGDLARWLPTNFLGFFGRVNGDQIKLRGFRIELDDVANALQSHPRVSRAAAKLLDAEKSTARLVGYVVAEHCCAIDDESENLIIQASSLAADALDCAKEILPSYAVPSSVLELRTLPVTARGKLDRTKLPDPPSLQKQQLLLHTDDAFVECATATERAIETVWQAMLGMDSATPISVNADFVSLGGNSLLAGRVTTKLRHVLNVQLPGTAVYMYPTISALATYADSLPKKKTAQALNSDTKSTPVSGTYKGLPSMTPIVMIGQFLVAVFSLIMSDVIITAPTLVAIYKAYLLHGPVYAAFIICPIFSLATPLFLSILAILANILLAPSVKKQLSSGYAMRRIKMYSREYLSWLLAKNITEISARSMAILFGGSGIEILFFRLCGADIGSGVTIESHANIEDPKWLVLCDGAHIGRHSRVTCHFFENGEIVFARTKIETNGKMQPRSCLSAGGVIPAGKSLGALAATGGGSLLTRDDLDNDDDDKLKNIKQENNDWQLLFGVPALLFCESLAIYFALQFVLGLIAQVCLSIFTNTYLQIPIYFGLAWLFHIVEAEAFFAVCVIVKKWYIGEFVQGEMKISHFKRWIWDQLVSHSLFEAATAPFVNTEVLAYKFRLLGAKIGKRVNMDCFDCLEFDLIEIGDEVVFGSCVVLAPYVATESDKIAQKIQIQRGANVLDHSVLLPGVIVEAGAVTGTMTLGPRNHIFKAGTVSTGRVGGAPVQLKFQGDVEQGTSKLPEKDKAKVIEALRKHRDPWTFYAFNAFALLAAYLLEPLEICRSLAPVIAYYKYNNNIFIAIAAFLWIEIFALIAVIILKFCVIGTYTVQDASYYDSLHIRWVLMMTCVSAIDNVLDSIQGTFLAPLLFRILGAKIGHDVCLFYSAVIEFDLLNIGDYASTGEDCDLTAHTVENMVVKFAPVTIGEGCDMGANAVLMPAAIMEPWSTLLEGSQVLKGETVGSGEVWRGLPAACVGDEIANDRRIILSSALSSPLDPKSLLLTTAPSDATSEAELAALSGVLGVSISQVIHLRQRALDGDPSAFRVFSQLDRIRRRMLARAGLGNDETSSIVSAESTSSLRRLARKPMPPYGQRPPHLRARCLAEALFGNSDEDSIEQSREILRAWRNHDHDAESKIRKARNLLFAAFHSVDEATAKRVFHDANAGEEKAIGLIRAYRVGGSVAAPFPKHHHAIRGRSAHKGKGPRAHLHYKSPPPPGEIHGIMHQHPPPRPYRDAALILAGALVTSLSLNVYLLRLKTIGAHS